MIKTLNTPDAGGAADPMLHSADQGIRVARQPVDQALEHLGERVGGVRAAASSMLDTLAGDATRLSERGSEAARDTARRLREHAQDVRESTRGYIRDEPVKSALIAMAVGAALMVLGGLLARGLRGAR